MFIINGTVGNFMDPLYLCYKAIKQCIYVATENPRMFSNLTSLRRNFVLEMFSKIVPQKLSNVLEFDVLLYEPWWHHASMYYHIFRLRCHH